MNESLSVDLIYIFVGQSKAYENEAHRFVDTYLKHPPLYDNHRVTVVCNQGEPSGLLADKLNCLSNARFLPHDNTGQDIGGFIAAAKRSQEDLTLFFGSNVYFFRRGWLHRMMEARKRHGMGLYCAQTSFEVTPHFHTTGFWCDRFLIEEYPYSIVTKEDRYDFEHGRANLSMNVPKADQRDQMTFWKYVYRRGYQVLLVTWDGEYQWWDWRLPNNIMRRGSQTNLLHWWKHSDEWFGFTSEQKRHVASSADTNTDPTFNFRNHTFL